MILHRSLIFLPILAASFAHASNVDALFTALANGTYKEVTFPKLTWGDIPELLKVSGDNTMLTHLPINALSSQMQTQASKGVVALWLIEGIRKGDRFASNNPMLVPSAKEGGSLETVSEENHPKALKAYELWWDRYGKMPQTRASKFDPLAGTDLHWF